MTDKAIFDQYRDEMQKIAQGMASHFGATAEEALGDEYGFEFAVERSDGDLLLATLTITPSPEGPNAGNFIVRASGNEGETVVNWGPDNHSAECWADYSDQDAWSNKLETVRTMSSTLAEQLQTWQATSSMTP